MCPLSVCQLCYNVQMLSKVHAKNAVAQVLHVSYRTTLVTKLKTIDYEVREKKSICSK